MHGQKRHIQRDERVNQSRIRSDNRDGGIPDRVAGPTVYVQQGLNPAIEYHSDIYDELEKVSASRECKTALYAFHSPT